MINRTVLTLRVEVFQSKKDLIDMALRWADENDYNYNDDFNLLIGDFLLRDDLQMSHVETPEVEEDD